MNRPLLALSGVALYFGLAFAARMLVHRRRTGATGWVGISGRPFSLRWWAGVAFALAAIVALLGPALEIANVVPPVAPLVAPSTLAFGVALAAFGIVGTIAAQARMGASWRIGVRDDDHTELVRNGVFSHVRNPIFTSLVLASAGCALIAPNVVTLAVPVLFLFAVELQVRFVEEPHLRRVHGDAYARYCRDVGRFVPGVGRSATA